MSRTLHKFPSNVHKPSNVWLLLTASFTHPNRLTLLGKSKFSTKCTFNFSLSSLMETTFRAKTYFANSFSMWPTSRYVHRRMNRPRRSVCRTTMSQQFVAQTNLSEGTGRPAWRHVKLGTLHGHCQLLTVMSFDAPANQMSLLFTNTATCMFINITH